MKKIFTSDWHLGHKRIITPDFSDRPWDTVEEMDAAIIENMFTGLKKNDMIFFLGDLYWNNQSFWKMYNQLPKGVRFIWVLGNHDNKIAKQHYAHFESISHMAETKIMGNHVVLCHYPMASWSRSHYNSFQLYGHHHLNGHHEPTVFGKQLNVNLEFHNYMPWTEEEIVEYMSHRPDNPDLVRR